MNYAQETLKLSTETTRPGWAMTFIAWKGISGQKVAIAIIDH
jgi:hypothetical protein